MHNVSRLSHIIVEVFTRLHGADLTLSIHGAMDRCVLLWSYGSHLTYPDTLTISLGKIGTNKFSVQSAG